MFYKSKLNARQNTSEMKENEKRESEWFVLSIWNLFMYEPLLFFLTWRLYLHCPSCLPACLPFFPFSSILSFVLSSATYNSIDFCSFASGSFIFFCVCALIGLCAVCLHFGHRWIHQPCCNLMQYVQKIKQKKHTNTIECGTRKKKHSWCYCFAYGYRGCWFTMATVRSLARTHNLNVIVVCIWTKPSFFFAVEQMKLEI